MRTNTKKGPSVYSIVTEKIVAMLQKGVVPWQRPWTNGGPAKNLVSKKEYRGINRFLLGASPYASPYFLSYKQIQDLKGKLKDGEGKNYFIVVFWRWLEAKGKKDDLFSGKEIAADKAAKSPQKGGIPLLRYYRVYNVEQTEGINYPGAVKREFEPIEAAESLVKAMPLLPPIVHGGNKACYWPSKDTVSMPDPGFFLTSEKYYGTLFHELIHSTGHPSRLARKGVVETQFFASHEYSKEELVAEMGAAFLCGHCGFTEAITENSAAYIQSWLKELENDEKFVVQAAAAAEKAVDFIKGTDYSKEKEETE
ncbi:MAG: zincin-like metallopeptidase domain-containing protein [Desulfobacteraceae bacterium]|nr:zincin-like metallopeptidase domain-containing protein [Desulfobacteraceae bacterium]